MIRSPSLRTIGAAARMFDGDYIVEEVPGGHFMHREHPDAFAERLLLICDLPEHRRLLSCWAYARDGSSHA